MRYKDLTGMKFDRLTVMGDVGKRTKGNGIIWKCICDCGNEVYVRTYSLGKDVKSCGCLRNEKLIQRSTTHGKKYTRVYREWKNIKQRCLNPKLPDYKYYGARGITICPEWANKATIQGKIIILHLITKHKQYQCGQEKQAFYQALFVIE